MRTLSIQPSSRIGCRTRSVPLRFTEHSINGRQSTSCRALKESDDHVAMDRVTGNLTLGAILGAALFVMPLTANAADPATTFGMSCAGCHEGGGNIIRPQSTLKLADLEKNGLVDPDALYKVIYSGKGSMPGFGEGCEPKLSCTFAQRLSDEDVKAMTNYVLDQAKAGWPKANQSY